MPMRLEHLDLLACPACHERLICLRSDGDAQGSGTEGPRLLLLQARVSGGRRRPTLRAARKLCLRFRSRVDQARANPVRQLLGNSCIGAEIFRSDGLAQKDARRNHPRGRQWLGPLTEQAASTGATVVSLDYSYAVDANYASNGSRDNVLIVQADVFAMPFRPQSFDRVFCFGMLQHTPSPSRAFAALPGALKAGGSLCADIYKVSFWRRSPKPNIGYVRSHAE